MRLLSGEQPILNLHGGKFSLTDRRVSLQGERFAGAYHMHIFLEDIASVEYSYRSRVLFLILGIISLVGIPFTLGTSIIPSVILFIIWWATREKIIRITSVAGTTLDIVITSLSAEKIDELMFYLLDAKEKRCFIIKGVGMPTDMSHVQGAPEQLDLDVKQSLGF